MTVQIILFDLHPIMPTATRSPLPYLRLTPGLSSSIKLRHPADSDSDVFSVCSKKAPYLDANSANSRTCAFIAKGGQYLRVTAKMIEATEAKLSFELYKRRRGRYGWMVVAKFYALQSPDKQRRVSELIFMIRTSYGGDTLKGVTDATSRLFSSKQRSRARPDS